MNTKSQFSAHPWFESGVALFSVWIIVGVYLDGWAHIRGLLENFFTPWHGVIYSGLLGVGALLAGKAVGAVRRGAVWRTALPVGYGLSLIGAGIFFIGGIVDLAWHTAFGIEAELEALYSPPHLLLAAGAVLIVSGPLRAAWRRRHDTRTDRWLAVLSATLILSILTFFTSESHPFVHPWASANLQPREIDASSLGLPPLPRAGVGTREMAQTIGIGSVILQSAALMSLLLLLVRRWGGQLPLGWIMFIFVVNAAGLGIFHDTPWVIVTAVGGGVVAEVTYRWLKPDNKKPARARTWAALVPAGLYASYFSVLHSIGGTWWSVHLWTGAIAIAAATGLLLGCLVFPPASSPQNGDS